MVYCSHCGTEIPNGATNCPSCGAPVGKTDGFAEGFANFNNTPDRTGEFDRADIEANKVYALFSYLSWLVLIPLLAAPNSKYARFHANQGLILAIAEVIYGIVMGVISGVFGVLFIALSLPFITVIITSLLSLISIVFLVFSIIGIVNAVNGCAKELPIIGKFRLLK